MRVTREMMSGEFRAVLDACVLANFGVCDLLLRLAEAPRLYLPRWSVLILEEVRHTQTTKLKPPWPNALADHWRQEVERAFPESSVSGFEFFIPQCSNNPKDRHVLAAAIQGAAETIVSFNLQHFPSAALALWQIEACHPEDFLINLFGISPAVVTDKLLVIARERGRMPEHHLAHLSKSVPAFAAHVAEHLGSGRRDAEA